LNPTSSDLFLFCFVLVAYSATYQMQCWTQCSPSIFKLQSNMWAWVPRYSWAHGSPCYGWFNCVIKIMGIIFHIRYSIWPSICTTHSTWIAWQVGPCHT
jgi:hypothetical protein